MKLLLIFISDLFGFIGLRKFKEVPGWIFLKKIYLIIIIILFNIKKGFHCSR